MTNIPKPTEIGDPDDNHQDADLAEQVRQLREEVAAMRRELDHLSTRQKWFY